MAIKDFIKSIFNHKVKDTDTDESGTEAGSETGTTIEFVDFIGHPAAVNESTFMLPEERHMVATHEQKSRQLVEKQKEKRDGYQQAKKQQARQAARQGMGSSLGFASDKYKSHPILSQKFSGADDNVTPNANDFEADTNEIAQTELREEYRLTNRPAPAPQPSMTPRFVDTPRLTPR